MISSFLFVVAFKRVVRIQSIRSIRVRIHFLHFNARALAMADADAMQISQGARLEGDEREDTHARDAAERTHRGVDGADARDRGQRRSGKDRRVDDDGPRARNRASVFDRLGQTNRARERGFKREGRGKNMGRDVPRRDGGDVRRRDDDRDFSSRGPPPMHAHERELPPMPTYARGPPPLPRGPPPGACDVSKGEDGVVVVRFFDEEIIRVAPTGEVRLCRPKGVDGTPRCDADVLNAFNKCLNKFGFKVSAAATDQTAWSLSDGKRLSRFHDGIVVPAPTPPGPGRGLALMLTAPVGSGGRRGGFRGGGERPQWS